MKSATRTGRPGQRAASFTRFLFSILLVTVCATGLVFSAGAQENPDPGLDPDAEQALQISKAVLATVEPIKIGIDTFSSRITGGVPGKQPLGLVLSGGSARAFAHIGVLAAMEEKGVRPDFIVANSMGAIVGLLYAAGMSPANIEQVVSEIPVADLIDLVLPVKGGFIDAGRFSAFVHSVVGDVDIAELPIPILLLFEDLATRRQVWIASGSLDRLMTASFALPGLFEPQKLGEMILIDGGVTGLVPVAAAQAFTSRVIASTAMYDRSQSFSNPLSVINRAVDIGKTRSAVTEMRAFKPIIIRNDVESISFMEFAEPGGIIRRGYDSARTAMPRILSLAGSGSDRKSESEGGGQSPELAEARARFKQSLPGALRKYSLGYSVPSPGQSLLRPLLRFADDYRDREPFLRGQRQVGVSWIHRRGPFELEARASLGLDGFRDRAWAFAAGARVLPVHGLFAGLDAELSGVGESGLFPLIDPRIFVLTGQAGYRAGLSRLVVAVGARGWAGTRLSGSSGSMDPVLNPYSLFGDPGSWAWYSRAGVELKTHDTEVFSGSVDGGWFVDSSGNAGPAWEASVWPFPKGAVSLRALTAGRHSLVGSGTVIPDTFGYRGVLPSWSSRGWILGSVDVPIRARFLEFDLAESVIVQNVELAPFVDVALSTASGPGGESLSGYAPRLAAAGLSLAGSVSLLGLAPIELSLSAAKELYGPGWRMTFATGRRYVR